MRRIPSITALLLALLLALPAASAGAATSPDEVLEDPVLEARARALGKGLRCLVCQNQSIDDSDADLAKDLRRIVRERLVAGDSDGAIRDYLVARYGEFVLLAPPMLPSTWLLWFGPLAIAAGGAVMIALFLRRRASGGEAPDELDPAERARLDRLLAEADRSGPGASGWFWPWPGSPPGPSSRSSGRRSAPGASPSAPASTCGSTRTSSTRWRATTRAA